MNIFPRATGEDANAGWIIEPKFLKEMRHLEVGPHEIEPILLAAEAELAKMKPQQPDREELGRKLYANLVSSPVSEYCNLPDSVRATYEDAGERLWRMGWEAGRKSVLYDPTPSGPFAKQGEE